MAVRETLERHLPSLALTRRQISCEAISCLVRVALWWRHCDRSRLFVTVRPVTSVCLVILRCHDSECRKRWRLDPASRSASESTHSAKCARAHPCRRSIWHSNDIPGAISPVVLQTLHFPSYPRSKPFDDYLDEMIQVAFRSCCGRRVGRLPMARGRRGFHATHFRLKHFYYLLGYEDSNSVHFKK